MKIDRGGSISVQPDGSLLFQHWHLDTEGETIDWRDAQVEILLWLLRKAIANDGSISSAFVQ